MKKLLTVLCCLIALQVTAQQHMGDVRLKTFPPRVIDDMVDRYLGWYGDTVYINPNNYHYLKIGDDLYEITTKSEIIKLDAAHGYINSKDWQTLPGKQMPSHPCPEDLDPGFSPHWSPEGNKTLDSLIRKWNQKQIIINE